MISGENFATFMEDDQPMSTPKPMSVTDFAAFMKQVKSESSKEFLLRKQRLRDRVAVAQAADRNRKQYSEERRQRAFKALQARKAEREKAAPPPPPKTPHQQHGGDIRRRTERQARHENELQKRKFEHDALAVAPVDPGDGAVWFKARYIPAQAHKRKQARWEKEQHFDQGVL